MTDLQQLEQLSFVKITFSRHKINIWKCQPKNLIIRNKKSYFKISEQNETKN